MMIFLFQRQFDVRGLQVIASAKSYTAPSTENFVFQVGVEHLAAYSKFKLLANVRTLLLESQLTYRFQPSAVLGLNLVLDPNSQKLTKYDFGIAHEPSRNLLVGLKHESNSPNELRLGKFFLHFLHYSSLVQTVGSEFILDWQKKQL